MGGKLKYYIIFTLCILCITNIACKNKVQLNKKANETIDSVLSYSIIINNDANCIDWDPPKRNELIEIINQLSEIDSDEWRSCYGDWSCGAEGNIIYEQVDYYFRIDAGGWIILSNDSIQRYFGCRNSQNCWYIFPSESFCDESGQIID